MRDVKKKKKKSNEGVYKKLITLLRAAEGGELREADGQTLSITTVSMSFYKLTAFVLIFCFLLSFLMTQKERKREARPRVKDIFRGGCSSAFIANTLK